MSFLNLVKAIFITLFFSTISIVGFSQDSTFFKSVYAGGVIVVPENQTWELDRVFITGGESYNLKISSANFNSIYHAGDTIKTPHYIAEMELLDTKDVVQYQFYFKSIR